MLVDTHAHLWFDEFRDDLGEVLARAKAARVEKIIVPGTNIESSKQALALAKQYPGVIYPAVGIHPEDAETAHIEEVRALLAEHKELIVAVGEIGMDGTITPIDHYTIEKQKVLFRAQCELALELDLPVIIHTRNSLAEALQVLDALPSMPRGQFHCFSHDEAGLAQVLSAGFHVSFCGNISWSKRVAKLVPLVPSDRLLLETDSPFMDPGKRNEPANVAKLADLIASLRGETLPAQAGLKGLGQSTSENAMRLFRL